MENSNEATIEAYRTAMRNGARIRYVVLLFILAAIGAHVTWLYERFVEFQREGGPAMVSELQRQLPMMDPRIQRQAADMFGRTAPVYMHELDRAFHDHQPKLTKATHDQLLRLQAHAEKRFPEIQAALADIIVSQEAAALETFRGIMTEEEATALSQRYGEVMLDKLNSVMNTDLKAHRAVASDIGRKLEILMSERQDAEAVADSHELMAIMLELSGRTLGQSL